jgi:hypothetical protein
MQISHKEKELLIRQNYV